jgi:hypothetical protein
MWAFLAVFGGRYSTERYIKAKDFDAAYKQATKYLDDCNSNTRVQSTRLLSLTEIGQSL